MAKCKDCLHYEACSNFSKIINSAVDVEAGCEHFKNRTDFAEVVRCKDCERRQKGNWCYSLHTYNGEPVGVADDFFCAYGKRKSDG